MLLQDVGGKAGPYYVEMLNSDICCTVISLWYKKYRYGTKNLSECKQPTRLRAVFCKI